MAYEKIKKNIFEDDVDHAWASYVGYNFSMNGEFDSGFSTKSDRLKTIDQYKKVISFFVRRFRHVRITNQDAFSLMKKFDRADAVFYLDPPYVHDTRSSGGYLHELADEQHKKLIDILPTLKAAVILSGYDTPLYAPLVDTHGWGVEKVSSYTSFGKTFFDRSSSEVLWYNEKVKDYLEKKSLPLFA